MIVPFRLLLALLITLILTIIPLPSFLIAIRPPWVLLLFLYVLFYKPAVFNLVLIFIVGLILDVLLSTVLGEHAFSLIFVAWLATNKQRRFAHFPIAQQIVLVGGLAFIYQFSLFCLDTFFGYASSLLPAFLSVGISMIIWPWLRLIGEETFAISVKPSPPRRRGSV